MVGRDMLPTAVHAEGMAMKRWIFLWAAVLVVPPAARAGNLPAREGECVWTKIARVEQRLQEGEHGPFVAGFRLGGRVRQWRLSGLV